MNIEQIEITIGTDGKIQLYTSGFSGETCLDATEEIEKLLGGKVLRREMTAAIYESSAIQTKEKVKLHH